ncbi:MAG: hypothetical protein A2750_03260 [Candidatus Yanofskybacteria bacterium RIFCSPHIGHO2_01_FULL_45_42]|uniref:Peptidase M6-like domain-containing protein n=2 Tax=Candidatus Yanofskyibacteriota TaxID=1752733 RepID=A0A1F8FSY3_9BACT|nr:MAG: hypothetical protein A2750_03260 [Candidatus Yanofskybacteria bacterium RIFCSPHIGHO2_01_FULL_45_42]OGN15830.1 MAG: hypothetical protein A3J47_02600 [Candidatus Yanofskybacteria bacterium RIFCSPHIGHO2_02_FULL_43_22]OGN28124.1 MAG: hypothetical protein A3B17_00450 [Candidatus Yanofskybacteria bacterium RIFCSPLOWO2_01_FULL_45_72]
MKQTNATRLLLKSLIVIFLFLCATGAQADVLNQNEQFFVNSKYDRLSRSILTATLRVVGDYAYFYVEDRYWNIISETGKAKLLNRVKELAAEFDSIIYPREIQFWGPEPNPGIDNDPRVTILVEDLLNTNGGYFETANEYPRTIVPESNQREMVAISARSDDWDKYFLAHEFQHLISYNQKELMNNVSEARWLNELRSEYSIDLAGYYSQPSEYLQNRMDFFLKNPSDSLTEWPNVPLDYGVAVVFGQYLKEQYGPEILRETMGFALAGIQSLDRFFASHNFPERFGDVFGNWMVANFINDTSVDRRYGYIKSDFQTIRVLPDWQVTITNPLSFNSSFILKNWQPAWKKYDLSYIPPLFHPSFEFKTSSEQRFLGVLLVFYKDGQYKTYPFETKNGYAKKTISNNQDNPVDEAILMITNGAGDNSDAEISVVPVEVVLSFSEKIIQEAQESAEEKPEDGALIKKKNEPDIYVINGRYKRYLSPEVIRLYGHLDSQKTVEVSPEVFNSYQISNYAKNINDEKVYAVWADGTKHWLDMSGEYFIQSGRDFGAVFVVNDSEINYYKTGESITR